MRIIDVPPVVDIDGKGKISFKEFLEVALNQYPPFGQGIKNMRQGFKIAQAIEAADGTLKLEDSDYETLKMAVESAKYNPVISRYCIPFLDAIEKAQAVKV